MAVDDDAGSARAGLLMGIGAHVMWGLFPLYFAVLEHVPPLTILGHRVVHSALFTAALATVTGTWPVIVAAIRDRRTLGLLTLTGGLISANWLVFIYAVVTHRTLEASLGYFISPLAIAMLGVVILRERLTPTQWLCVGLAAVAVAVRAAWLGSVPWISLFLPATFGVYSLLRKLARAGSQTAMTIETFTLLPVGAAYLAFVYAATDPATPEARSPATLLVLSLGGVLTVVPLLLFGGAARRLRLVSLGFLQYAGPTLQMLLAVTVLGEPFRPVDFLVFFLIWLAVALFTGDAVVRERRRRRAAAGASLATAAEG